ncbi:hypothetical protein Dimus_015456 [Dionaea muscipula]
MQGKNRTKEPVKYCKPGSIDHYLRLKKRKHVNDELLDIHVPHVDEQHQEPEIAEDDEQDLNLEMEDDVNLLPDDCEDLALEEEDLNFEEDRHEESLLSTETGKETNPEAEADCTDRRLSKTKEKMWSYAQKKWIIPDEGKKWVLATINGSWRRHKTLIKKKYYKLYDNDKERLLNRPKGIPEEQFKGFIEMVGSKKYKQQANANKEPPTLVEMFTKTRKRVATREYKESFEDTERKIAEMEQLQAQQGENCSTSDPFSAVMPKEHTGRVKASSSSTSIVIDGITVNVPVDLVKSITASVKSELTQEILSTVLINLQRVIPNLDSDSILAGLVAGIQSPGDAVSGHRTRNASSSVPTHTPSFNQIMIMHSSEFILKNLL